MSNLTFAQLLFGEELLATLPYPSAFSVPGLPFAKLSAAHPLKKVLLPTCHSLIAPIFLRARVLMGALNLHLRTASRQLSCAVLPQSRKVSATSKRANFFAPKYFSPEFEEVVEHLSHSWPMS